MIEWRELCLYEILMPAIYGDGSETLDSYYKWQKVIEEANPSVIFLGYEKSADFSYFRIRVICKLNQIRAIINATKNGGMFPYPEMDVVAYEVSNHVEVARYDK